MKSDAPSWPYPYGRIQNLIQASSSVIKLSSYFMTATVVLILLIVYLVLKFSISRPLKNSITEIANASNEVSAASDQISASASGLAQAASEQASAVGEVNASLESSVAMLDEGNEHSKKADELARGADSAAKAGNEKVNELTGAMKRINDFQRSNIPNHQSN